MNRVFVLCSQALQLLMRVPRVCDLGQIVPQLVSLRQFDAVVELTLKVRAGPLSAMHITRCMTRCWDLI